MTGMRVLAIDDSPEDLMLLRGAWNDARVDAALETAGSAEEALGRLTAPPEDLALLIVDQNMPRLCGAEFIALARRELELFTPIVVMSTSASPRDVDACYRAGASAYLVKPVGVDELISLAKCIDAFWLRANRCVEPRR